MKPNVNCNELRQLMTSVDDVIVGLVTFLHFSHLEIQFQSNWHFWKKWNRLDLIQFQFQCNLIELAEGGGGGVEDVVCCLLFVVVLIRCKIQRSCRWCVSAPGGGFVGISRNWRNLPTLQLINNLIKIKKWIVDWLIQFNWLNLSTLQPMNSQKYNN